MWRAFCCRGKLQFAFPTSKMNSTEIDIDILKNNLVLSNLILISKIMPQNIKAEKSQHSLEDLT